MNTFVRFVLVLLAAGSAIGVGIVMLADVRGGRQQASEAALEKELFADVVDRFSGKQAHALIGVDWQKTDASQQVMESSLLVRNFTLGADGKESPLPIQRIVIPRDRICVQGLKLSFDDSFSEDYKDLRGKNLLYVHYIYADGGDPEKGLALVKRGRVPMATKMHEEHATQFEMQLWQYLWEVIDMPRDARNGLTVTPDPLTWIAQDSGKTSRGPAATMTAAESIYVAARKVTNGAVYSVYVAGDDGTTIIENNDPALLPDMRREAAGVEEQKSQKPSAPESNAPETN